MADSAAELKADAQKRRSERIAQAVPVIVTGVDALGRAFREQTSTVVISCHGCRYYSKHYVLKNMWVTLEVPHPDSHEESHFIRAQVKWVQRPRTVRELFHIAIELENPGNIWGLAADPAGWSLFSRKVEPVIHPAPELHPSDMPKEPSRHEAPKSSKVRVLPIAGVKESKEVPQMLLEQLAVLVEEGKQQLHESLSEMLLHSAEAHTESLSANWEIKLEALVRNVVQEIAPVAARRAVQETLGSMHEDTSRFDERCRNAINELQRRSSLILEAQSREIAIYAEQAAAKAIPGIHAAMESATNEAVLQLKNTLGESLQEIRRERREMANDSEIAVQTTRGRLQETVNRISTEFEARLAERARTASDSLAKAHESELEVKAQDILNDAMQKADAKLRDQAGEVLVVFGQELENYSRSSLMHARERFDEEARDSAARVKTELEKALSLNRERVLADAEQQINFTGRSALREFEAACRASQHEIQQKIALAGNEAAAQHRQSLENASNVWLLTSASRLHQHSRQLLDSIAGEAQTKLSESCAAVFNEFSANLRKRILNSSQSQNVKGASAGK